MECRQIGIVWPEPVQERHRTELQAFVGPDLVLDIEPVRTDPDPEPNITLALVEGLARDPQNGHAARRLAERGAQALAYGCTSASYVLGPEGDAAIIDEMQAASGLPATTTSSAVVEALRVLGVKSVAVLSPHIDDLNARLRVYLETAGFTVASMVGLNLRCDIEDVEPAETREIVESQVDRPDADAVFISCTGMRTAGIIDDIEASLGKPLVTANQATLWHARQLAGISSATPDRGRLLAASRG
ncbi:MAG: aspartate/glutamate racemase family protein [Chloroflexota bacterium]|nr:aspartate/glutamate racemase family protein [Chloroflexota bacterium]